MASLKEHQRNAYSDAQGNNNITRNVRQYADLDLYHQNSILYRGFSKVDVLKTPDTVRIMLSI